jgi:hypothetical protein
MYTDAAEVRRIRCLEAALFAVQDARFSQLTRPTEFVASILRRDDRLKIYFGASDQMFPPNRTHGFSEIAADIAAGWHTGVVSSENLGRFSTRE